MTSGAGLVTWNHSHLVKNVLVCMHTTLVRLPTVKYPTVEQHQAGVVNRSTRWPLYRYSPRHTECGNGIRPQPRLSFENRQDDYSSSHISREKLQFFRICSRVVGKAETLGSICLQSCFDETAPVKMKTSMTQLSELFGRFSRTATKQYNLRSPLVSNKLWLNSGNYFDIYLFQTHQHKGSSGVISSPGDLLDLPTYV